MAESTLVQKFFSDLDNRELYERVDDIPVFCPHVRIKTDQATGKQVKIEVTAKDIDAAAKEMTRLEKENGVLPIITPGHRNFNPESPETAQPAIWGYARHGKPGTFKTPDGKTVPCLLVSYYLDKKKLAEDGTPVTQAARGYPFRSVDYYSDTKEISGIALLRRDPELDLGMVSYGQDKRSVFQYGMENMIPDPTKEPDARDDEGADGEDELLPEEKHTADRYMCHYIKNHPHMKRSHEQYMAECGGAGGMGAAAGTPASISPTNSAMPGAKKKEPQMNATTKTPEQLASETIPEQYAREIGNLRKEVDTLKSADLKKDKEIAALKKENVATAEQLAAEQKTRRLVQYKADLEKLSLEYEMDVDAELENAEMLTPTQFEKNKERIQKNYRATITSRIPMAFARGGYEGSNGNGQRDGGRLNEDQEEQVIQYMRENPTCTDWEVAKKAVLKN